MGDWDTTVLSGPEGEDWRVPVSELENRLERLARALRVAALPGALIQHPVDLYYFAGGRQDGSLFVPAEGTEGDGPVFFVRRSLERARFEAGGDNAPFKLESFPRLSQFADVLKSRGVSGAPWIAIRRTPIFLCSTICFSTFFVRRVQRCDRNCPSTPRSQISLGTRTNGPWC